MQPLKDSKHRISAARRNHLKAYGLTPEAYDALQESQNYTCKICQKPELHKSRAKSFRGLSVDHNHVTGEVRGLLCSNCNTMLGLAEENQTVLLRAIQYLKRAL